MNLARARTGWVIYAALLTFGVLAGEARNVSLSGEVSALTFANWVLSAVLLTAVWGYALQRAVGTAAYWRAAFWLVLFANAVMLVPVLLVGGPVVWFTGALTLLIVPAYVAAFRYGYRSPGVWGASTTRS
ncbi:MAG: hypothetical protein OEW50_03595 [Gammaproteobacteria bacterium]|nr:hypothetical protein [Gammaproteobacteria bacterium]